jgi:hypothetical protein
MRRFPYIVTAEEEFLQDHFPNVKQELQRFINEAIFAPSPIKAEMLIYYLENHAVKMEWIQLYPEVIKLLTSRYAYFSHSESLFAACVGNEKFRQKLRQFVCVLSFDPRSIRKKKVTIEIL